MVTFLVAVAVVVLAGSWAIHVAFAEKPVYPNPTLDLPLYSWSEETVVEKPKKAKLLRKPKPSTKVASKKSSTVKRRGAKARS